MADELVFEQPLNERTRIFMRVEHLVLSALHALKQDSWWDTRNFLVALDDLIGLMERCDIRTELYKEIDRQRKTLVALSQAPGVDAGHAERAINALDDARSNLEESTGKIAHELRNNEFLSAIRARIGVPGGSCSFDIPAYHQWLSLPYQIRAQHMQHWLGSFQAIIQAVNIVLTNTRQSASRSKHVANAGLFQHDMDPKQPAQMLRLTLPQDRPFYPEISANKHRLNIRFMENSIAKASQRVDDDVPFVMACCYL